MIDKVARFLDGKEDSIVKDLKAEMRSLSDAMQFEKAAKVRVRHGR